MPAKVAVVTGSNKGIGLAIVKGLCKRYDGVVYLTSRDERRGRDAVNKLRCLGLHPEYHQLDVADRDSVERFSEFIKEKHSGLDVLINNAAQTNSLIRSSFEEDKTVIDINYKSVLVMQELIYPLIRENGRILNISSDCGHLSNIKNKYWLERLSDKNLTVKDINEFVDWFLDSSKNRTVDRSDFADNGTVAAYRVSKVALSASSMIKQEELESRNISVNSMHPGLVRTDMTVGIGFFTPDQAAETPLYIVLDAPQSLKRSYIWYDKRVLDWYDYNADYYFKLSDGRSWILSSVYSNIKDYLSNLLKF